MQGPFAAGLGLALALLLAARSAAPGAPDVTPLESTAGLSSGFGEFRDAHFHAGLDYSTNEEEGHPVRAVNDGWVERVRASGVGYGRAIYLRLDDGRTVVYGHLQRFAPRLDAFVAAHQESAGVYEQDLSPLPGLIRFARGEIVGWNGQSGAGPPHLHFEVRRGDENFNPLLHGFAMPDHVAPTLAAAWITPHGPHARVAGSIDPVRVVLRAGAAVTVPPVAGPFDLAVDTWDRADARPNKLATYRLEARVDGAATPAFEAVVDSFSWDTTVEVERVYDYAATLAGDDTRRTLCKLPSYQESVVRRGPAFWSLAPGTHRIEVAAVDEVGNRATATLVVPVVEPGKAAPAPAGRRRAAEPALGVRLRGTVLYVTSPASELSPGTVAPGIPAADSLRIGNAIVRSYDLTAMQQGHWVRVQDGLAGSPVPGHESGLATGPGGYLMLQDTPDTMRVKGGEVGESTELDIVFLPHAVFEPSGLRVSPGGVPDAAGELLALSPAVEVAPSDLVLRAAVRATFRTTAALGDIPRERTGLFLKQRSAWSFVGTFEEHAGYVGVTRRLGTFAVFADTTAPFIAAAPVTTWRHASADAPPPRLSAIIRDRGAGLAPADQAIYLDGRRVPAEYDPEASRLNWYPRAWPAAGRHEVRFEATDRLGNRSVRAAVLAVD